jgi:hypothetical protein
MAFSPREGLVDLLSAATHSRQAFAIRCSSYRPDSLAYNVLPVTGSPNVTAIGLNRGRDGRAAI